MRKLLMVVVVVVVLAALAVSASSASAINTDFPYKSYPSAPLGDREADNWTAVNVIDVMSEFECFGPCEFDTGSANAWVWSAPSPFGPGRVYGSCVGGLEGDVDTAGNVAVTDVTHGGGVWGNFGDGLCMNYEPIDLEDWTGLACHHVPTGDIWLRQNVVMGTNSGAHMGSGETYGEIISDAEGESEALEFRTDAAPYYDTDLALVTGSGANLGWKHNATFPFTGMAFTAAEGPCGWSELS